MMWVEQFRLRGLQEAQFVFLQGWYILQNNIYRIDNRDNYRCDHNHVCQLKAWQRFRDIDADDPSLSGLTGSVRISECYLAISGLQPAAPFWTSAKPHCQKLLQDI